MTPSPVYDVAIIGGGLAGSMAALMLQRRGFHTVVLESRAEGQPQKTVVGEAFTEGTSVFLDHELGMGDWLREHGFRKYGFDFVTQPRAGAAPHNLDGCHELLLSLTPLETIPGAFPKLIPTYHVDRPRFDAELARRARLAGAEYRYAAPVRRVVLDEHPRGQLREHRVLFGAETPDGTDPDPSPSPLSSSAPGELRCRWVLDTSGRRRVLGKQLGITSPMAGLRTAAIWTHFTNVRDDSEFWQTFRGIDRRRHTIHFSGPGFWFWWIHLDDDTTSVGVTFDRDQHEVDIKAEDRGFWEMAAEFPALEQALAGARPKGPYHYYANLPYQSSHWISTQGYALIGDAATFVDPLYSIGVEMACRQLIAALPLIQQARQATRSVCAETVARLNRDHALSQESVRTLNKFKYEHAWHQPHVLMQTALYDLAEIAELYHLQESRHWTPDNLDRNYRLQWSSEARRDALIQFMQDARADAQRDRGTPELGGRSPRLLAKALLPGRLVYSATWPLWRLPKARPYFFIITRLWGYMERMSQRHLLWPDILSLMAGGRGPGPAPRPVEIRRRADDHAA